MSVFQVKVYSRSQPLTKGRIAQGPQDALSWHKTPEAEPKFTTNVEAASEEVATIKVTKEHPEYTSDFYDFDVRKVY